MLGIPIGIRYGPCSQETQNLVRNPAIQTNLLDSVRSETSSLHRELSLTVLALYFSFMVPVSVCNYVCFGFIFVRL